MNRTTLAPTSALAPALALAAMAWLSPLAAQGTDDVRMPAVAEDRAACAQVDWHQDLLGALPWVASACREVVTVDGERWARFEAGFIQMNPDRSITVDFRDPRAAAGNRAVLMPAEDQRVLLDGQPRRFSELRRGQRLNFYVPEGRAAFAGMTTGGGQGLAVPVTAPAPDMRPQVQLAQAEPRPQSLPTRLPATAGALPLLAFAGVLLLVTGFGMSLVRTRAKRLPPPAL